MSKLKVLSGKTNQSSAPHKVCEEVDYGTKSGPPTERITANSTAMSESRSAINYILGV